MFRLETQRAWLIVGCVYIGKGFVPVPQTVSSVRQNSNKPSGIHGQQNAKKLWGDKLKLFRKAKDGSGRYGRWNKAFSKPGVTG